MIDCGIGSSAVIVVAMYFVVTWTMKTAKAR